MYQRRNQRLGRWGEEQACRWLVRRGFSIIARNYHATAGEIDIVARLADDYYFIEVKTREPGELATDLAVTPAKRHKLEKTVRHFCYHRQINDGSFILASLLVVPDRRRQTLHFRLAVMY